MTRQNCKEFLVLPPSQCYEVDYSEWRKFFEEESLNEVMNRTKNSFAVHFWNVMSNGQKLSTKSKTAYIEIATEFCPKVLKAAGDYF